MKLWDAVVVGAGPAGSTAAKFLAEAGLDTLLIDKEKFPRDKPCGGGITSKVFDKFKYLKELKDKIKLREIHVSNSSVLGKVNMSSPLITTTRKIFDTVLYKLAIKAGASILTARVVDLKITNKGVVIKTEKNKKIHSKAVIGADGANSIIAKKTGLNPCDLALHGDHEALSRDHLTRLFQGYLGDTPQTTATRNLQIRNSEASHIILL